MDLIRLVLYHSRIANAHIHGFRISNSEERGFAKNEAIQTLCLWLILWIASSCLLAMTQSEADKLSNPLAELEKREKRAK